VSFDRTDVIAEGFGDEASCARVREEAAAYLLGALPPDESDRVAEHRLLCRECDRALSRAGQVTALLALASPVVTPSPDVRRRLMDAVAGEPRTPVSVPPATEGHAAGTALASNAWWRRRYAAVVPLVLLFALLGGWTIYSQAELAESREDIARLERSNEAMSVHLGSLQAGQLAFGAGASSFQMTSVDESAHDAGGVVVSGVGNTTTVLSVWNMPDEHDSYHVICESEMGELLAAGEIIVNDRGNGTVTLTLPAPVTEFRAVHVLPSTSGGSGAAELLANDILQALFKEPELDAGIPD
jgi:hypothetical protein